MHARTRPTLYQQLEALPEGLTGEILGGQLHTQPRPSWSHALAGSSLGDELVGPFQKGRGGPGGWWIIDEPEVHFLRDLEVAVPDLGGWRRERMGKPPEGHRVEVVPDWVCEILSPATASRDRQVKMPFYARHGVAYAWLVDPTERTLEAYALEAGTWRELGRFAGTDRVALAPFDAVTIELAGLWVPPSPDGDSAPARYAELGSTR
jgi:Uma2 family endonuclease